MTDRDEQLDRALLEALDDAKTPPPTADAKRRAIAMARAEFEAESAKSAVSHSATETEKTPQGFFEWLRLIVSNQADNRRAPMYADNKLAYGGIAAVAIGAIAVGITLQNQTQLVSNPLPKSEISIAHSPVAGGSIRPGSGQSGASLEGAVLASRVDRDAGTPAVEHEFESRPKASPEFNAKPEPKLAQEVVSAQVSRPQPAPVQQPKNAHLPDSSLAAAAVEESRFAVAGSLSSGKERTPRAKPAVSKHEQLALAGLAAMADMAIEPGPGYREQGRDRFEAFAQSPVKLVAQEPVSTFSADVDTASYSFVRRRLNAGVLPQPDAVRAEEMINYFDYDYPLPISREEPFQPTVAVTDAPWADGRKLMHIGVKGYDIAPQLQPRSNLVFLLDVSGSMNSPDKLPLVKQSMEMLLSTLHPEDTVAIAVYAGAAGTVLEPTPVKDRQKILAALRQLSAGGSTAGAQGIRLAYELAASSYDENAVNRVILATDGDFNVGITNDRELQGFVERKRDDGIFLSVLGFGQGNYQDARMQALAQNGNGVAAYIDTLGEAQKVLVDEATSALFPIAKDVKFQVEFNPATVSEYRLIGYETRHLAREDFNNDAVDAGDMGAGHTVTAIYEFTPVGSDARLIEDSRYAPAANVSKESLDKGGEYAFVKIRYKLPDQDVSQLITRPVTRADSTGLGGEGIGHEAGFATAVAGFAQLLKGGKYTGSYDYDDVIELALQTRGDDPFGYRNEFVQLVRKARTAASML